MSSLDHVRHQICEDANSQVDFPSIIYVSLVNLECVQQTYINYIGITIFASSRIKHEDWSMLVLK